MRLCFNITWRKNFFPILSLRFLCFLFNLTMIKVVNHTQPFPLFIHGNHYSFPSWFYTVPPVCGTKLDDCHPTRATCEDTGPGSYKCTCKPDFVGDGKTCEGMSTIFCFYSPFQYNLRNITQVSDWLWNSNYINCVK